MAFDRMKRAEAHAQRVPENRIGQDQGGEFRTRID